ncbi:hypothetical protein GGI43DRAFT_55136 [Trichoderma evansii]
MMETPRAIWSNTAITLLVAIALNLSYNFIFVPIHSSRAKKSSRKQFVPQKYLTLRISNIPRCENNKDDLENILSNLPIEAQGIGGKPKLLRYSYSPDTVSNSSTKDAVVTATFEHAPAISELEMVLKQKLGNKASHLKVDQDFLGMTPLSDGNRVERVFLRRRLHSSKS